MLLTFLFCFAYFPVCMLCKSVSACMCAHICVQLAETALQLEGSFALLPWRDQVQRLAWCIRFAPLTKRSEYVTTAVCHN